MTTMNVFDNAGAVVAVEKPLAPGRAPAAASRPVTLSNEDFAVIDGLEALIGSTNTSLASILAKIIAAPATEATLAAQSAKFPSVLGQGTMAQSLKVVIASDQSALPISKSATIDDLADITLTNGSATSLVASDATRREAIICADIANTVAIRIGSSATVGAARGVALQPGQSITLTTTAAIYGYAGAASQKVSITLLKD